ncbi:MAG: response regulator [Alphaproteobacteria bacterium]|nr:MAG: response regulator [Alphaproteobacteria bacterium]
MADVSGFLDDQIFAALRQDFLVEARERLDDMEAVVTGCDGDSAEALICLHREAHSLKGFAGSVGFPSITLIAHRLEDYLAEVRVLDRIHADNVLIFIDRLRAIVEAGQDPGDAKTGALLRTLPAHIGLGIDANEIRRIEVVLVTPARAVGRMVAAELRALGLRVTTLHSPWEAIETTARTEPDLVITSAVMDGVTGIDLARALRAMSVTEHLNLALLTSLAADDPTMRRLPGNVPVIRLGPSLTEELADVVTHYALI